MDPEKETLWSPRWDTLLDPSQAYVGMSSSISLFTSIMDSGNL